MIMGITKRYNGTQLEQELTKPCPLMPDGEWVKWDLTLTKNDSNVWEKSWSCSSEKFGSISTSDIGFGGGQAVNTIDAFFFIKSSVKYQMAECRCTIDTTHTTNSNTSSYVYLKSQDSSGWFIRVYYDGGRQNNQEIYTVLSSLTSEYLGGSIHCTLYTYLVPTDN